MLLIVGLDVNVKLCVLGNLEVLEIVSYNVV